MDLQSEQINELATALSKAQAEIMPALKDSANPFFKSKYADLESVWSACREPLTKQGLCVFQSVTSIEGQLTLITTLAHGSGQYMRSIAPIITAKMDPQGIGSAISYFRRYSLAALVGVVQSDDDAEAAQPRRSSSPAVMEQIAAAPRVQSAAISEKQLKWLMGEIGNDVEFSNRALQQFGIQSLSQLPKSEFNPLMERLKAHKEMRTNVQSADFLEDMPEHVR